MKERDKNDIPQIIDDLNANLKPSKMTVEAIAEKIGISKAVLYEWIKLDKEFVKALKIIKQVQEDDPFKTGLVEDNQVDAMIITLLLLETRERHYPPDVM